MLESEVSRLLSINAEISQENIALRVRTDGRFGFAGVQRVKAKLEQHMQLLGGLVEELAAMQSRPEGEQRPRTAIKPDRSEEEKADEGGRQLPTIREDNVWQCESLEPRDSLDSIDSQTFAPPSTANTFPVEDPTKSETIQPGPSSDNPSIAGSSEDSFDASCKNLDTGRRRRDSNRRATITRNDTTPISTDKTGIEGQELLSRSTGKLGLKRKLDVRDDDADRRAKTSDSRIEFSKQPSKSTLEKDLNHKGDMRKRREAQKMSNTNVPPERLPFSESEFRVEGTSYEFSINNLAEPVNTDPVVSPKKPRRGLLSDKYQKPSMVSFAKDYVTLKPSDADKATKQRIVNNHIDTEQSMIPPEKPPIADVFSPPPLSSSERPIAKDTPPPIDLSSNTNSIGVEPVGRVARRARAVVNYAEPSLTTKMRRPTKELVDAVGKDGRPIAGSMVTKSEEMAAEQWLPKSNEQPDVSGTAGHDEAHSPLFSKVGPVLERGTMNLSPIRAHKPVYAGLLAPSRDLLSKNANPSVSILSHDRPSANSATRKKKIADIKESELAVCDFKDSSPQSQSREDPCPRKSGTNRRHSSLVENENSTKSSKATSSLNHGPTEGTKDLLARSSRSIARRKSMMI